MVEDHAQQGGGLEFRLGRHAVAVDVMIDGAVGVAGDVEQHRTADDTALVADHDLVLDGTDSFASRAAVNAACVAAGVPLIAGAIAQWEGQVALYDPARGGPCMACVFPDAPAPGLAPPCAEAAPGAARKSTGTPTLTSLPSISTATLRRWV